MRDTSILALAASIWRSHCRAQPWHASRSAVPQSAESRQRALTAAEAKRARRRARNAAIAATNRTEATKA